MGPDPRTAIFQLIIDTLRRDLKVEFEDEDFNPTSRLIDDVGVDSLEVVDLTMSLEDILGVNFQDEDVERVITINDFIDLIRHVCPDGPYIYRTENRNLPPLKRP